MLLLNASSITFSPPGCRTSCSLCSAGLIFEIPRAICFMLRPSERAAEAQRRIFLIFSSPSNLVVHSVFSSPRQSRKVLPSGEYRISSARISSFSGSRPVRCFRIFVFSYSALQISPSSAKKASPSSGSASISSYLAFATRSTVLKVSRCCGPTDVSKPICG